MALYIATLWGSLMHRSLLALALCAIAPVAQARPVVLELFTSQGCSSCPPADAVLAKVAQQADVIALSTPVDYWDNLGWKDRFARPENTARQHAYASRWGSRSVYTPQLVINGTLETVGSRGDKVSSLIEQERKKPAAVSVVLARMPDGAVTVNLQGAASARGSVRLVWVRAQGDVAVRAGENGGRTLHYTNIVIDEAPLGKWTGTAVQLTAGRQIIARHKADRLAVIVQDGVGPVLGAAMLDL